MSTPAGIRPPDDYPLIELIAYLERELGPDLNRFVDGELERVDIRITPAARLMLLLPLFEVRPQRRLFRKQYLRLEEAGPSLRKLIATMAESPAQVDLAVAPNSVDSPRTALSVIKAYWARFCNIPPFCGEQ